LRIIFHYLIPRIIPLLVPQLVVLVPTFVFLEASLAVLGLGDPILPTWGKIIDDARSNGAVYQGLYYWILEPSILLVMTGLGFAMVGFALDRIFNPRLRGL
ncbi:MAG: ABC transporter permease, partial [Anaerolineae bacterium]